MLICFFWFAEYLLRTFNEKITYLLCGLLLMWSPSRISSGATFISPVYK